VKLKKPAKDHRGEWPLVIDNEGVTVGAVRWKQEAQPSWTADPQFRVRDAVQLLWPFPDEHRVNVLSASWHVYTIDFSLAVRFLDGVLGVDTTPLEKLRKEKDEAATDGS